MISGPRSNGVRSSVLRAGSAPADGSGCGVGQPERQQVARGHRVVPAHHHGGAHHVDQRLGGLGLDRGPPAEDRPQEPPRTVDAEEPGRGEHRAAVRVLARHAGLQLDAEGAPGVLGGAALARDAGRDLGPDVVPDALGAGGGEGLQLDRRLAEDGGHPHDRVGLLVDLQAQLHAGDPREPQRPQVEAALGVLDLGAVERTGRAAGGRHDGQLLGFGVEGVGGGVGGRLAERRRVDGAGVRGGLRAGLRDGVHGARRGRLGRLGRLLAGTAEDAHGSGQSFGRSCCAWSAGRPGVPNPPLAPCPVSPRWLPGSDPTSRKSARHTSWMTSWAIRSPRRTVNGSGAVGVDQVDLDLPAVPGVHRPRGVQRGHAVPGRQPGPRVHERGVARGQGDRDAGRHEGARTGLQRHVRPGVQVRPGVAGVGVAGDGKARVEPVQQHRHRRVVDHGGGVGGCQDPGVRQRTRGRPAGRRPPWRAGCGGGRGSSVSR